MKKFIAICILLLLLTCVVIWEQITINKYLDHIENLTEEIQLVTMHNTNINTTEILEMVENLENKWVKYEQILCLVASHKDMQTLTIEIQKMKANVAVNQYEDFQTGVNSVLFLINSYYNFMGVSVHNIF